VVNDPQRAGSRLRDSRTTRNETGAKTSVKTQAEESDQSDHAINCAVRTGRRSTNIGRQPDPRVLMLFADLEQIPIKWRRLAYVTGS
jgi:hypothetical protein